MRWYWTIDDADGFRNVILDADPDTAIELIAQALQLPLATVAPGAPADAAAADWAPVSGSILPLRNWHPDRPDVALRIRSGPLAGQIVALSGSSFTIGRAEGSDVHLPDPAVSREHGRLHLDDAVITLRPSETAAPTRVNGELVAGE